MCSSHSSIVPKIFPPDTFCRKAKWNIVRPLGRMSSFAAIRAAHVFMRPFGRTFLIRLPLNVRQRGSIGIHA